MNRMSINRKFILVAALGAALSVSSCKKFLDINKNPNESATATVETLLPGAQLYVASTLGVDLQINGGIWGEHWTQSPNASQYKSLEQYAPQQDNFSTPWVNLYKAGENFYQLGKLADSTKKKQYKVIALIMKAYTFQLITDAWGDVPYTEALKGLVADSNIVSPHYDSQRVVYNGILNDIDTALFYLNPSDAVLPGKDDLIYGGDMDKWRKFAYTLKLRIYMRMSEIDPVAAQAGVAALYADPNTVFITTDKETAKIGFGYSSASKSPLYAEATSTTLAGTQNLAGSKTCIDEMNNNNDYRLYVFYTPTSGGSFVGIRQGNYNTPAIGGTYSLPSAYVAGDASDENSAKAPVHFLTASESLYLQAEAVARGWATGDDVSLFYAGLRASFDLYSWAYDDMDITWQDTTGLGSGSGYVLPSGATLLLPVKLTSEFAYYSYIHGDTTYLTTPAVAVPAPASVYNNTMTTTDKIKTIITQKWFGMCGNQAFEAWTEHRRTGYPDFLVVSATSVAGPTLPKRFLYPTLESTRNANFPGMASLTTKMWWDIL